MRGVWSLSGSSRWRGWAADAAIARVSIWALAVTLQAGTLVVVEKGAGAVGFYSDAGKVLREVAVGGHPHELAVSADGRYGFTSDNGVMLMTEKTAGGNSVSIVDLKARKKVGVIDLGKHRRPHGIDFDTATGHVLVTTELPSALLVLDVAKRAVVGEYDIQGRAPHMVVLGPDHRTAWITCTDTGNLAVVDLVTHAVELIPVGARPQGLVLSPDFRRVYVANSDGYSVTVVDAGTRKVLGEIPMGGKHSGPVRVAISRDGKTAIGALQLDHAISFANTETMKEEATISLPGSPVSMSLSKDGLLAYCSIQDMDTVYVVSVAERKVLRTFRTPKDAHPDPVRDMGR
jgi:YVTN family beta-propeller protein